MNPIVSIGKKEFLEHTRRGGVIVIALLFAALTSLVGILMAEASRATGGLLGDGMAPFLFMLQLFVGMLVPIIVMLLAHGSIAGELEAGSLALMLAQPVTRAEVVVGKFLGLFAASAAAIGLGFALAGGIIRMRSVPLDWAIFAGFTGETILFAGAYLGLFLLFSALVKRRSAAMILSIVAWVVLGMIWDFLIGTLLVTVGGIAPEALLLGDAVALPWWFTLSQIVSPPDMYVWVIRAAHDITTSTLAGRLDASVRDTVLGNVYSTVAILVGWIVVTVAGAWAALNRRDV